MAAALVVGNMIGSGVFLLPASLGAFGGISLVGWLFTSAGAMLLALTFAWLARAIPRAGGPYAYARVGFGEFPAFLVAWGYWLSICAGNAAIAVAGVGYLGVFAPSLAASPARGAAAAVLVVWLLTWVNIRGVRTAGGVQVVTTVLKLVPLVAIGAFGISALDPGSFVPFNVSGRSGLGAVSATATLTLWAFLGLESATIPADEVERPERTIPRATLLGTAVAAVVYIAGTAAVMGLLRPSVLARSGAPFADAAAVLWGPWAAKAVAAGAVVSCFGALNGWILLQGQLPLAAATDGVLPRLFGRRSARGTPVAGLVLSSALVSLFVATSYSRGLVVEFTFIILLATLATLVPYVFSTLAYVVAGLRRRAPFPTRPSATRLGIALLAFGYSLWAIAGIGGEAFLWGTLLLLSGVPFYLRTARRTAG